MSRRKKRTCPFCQTTYRGACCPLCREERLHMQSTHQPCWDEVEDMLHEEESRRRSGEVPHYAYDYGLDD